MTCCRNPIAFIRKNCAPLVELISLLPNLRVVAGGGACAAGVRTTIVRADIPQGTGSPVWVTIPSWNPSTHSISAFIDNTIVPISDLIGLEGRVDGNKLLIEGSPDTTYPNGIIAYLTPICQ